MILFLKSIKYNIIEEYENLVNFQIIRLHLQPCYKN